jgi:murein DD-endopeptidase MepM/ murein hydrolase activator NlpD
MNLNPGQLVATLTVAVFIVGVATANYLQERSNNAGQTNLAPETINTQKTEPKPVFEEEKTTFATPLNKTDQRVTKKKFGTYVTPQNSPVSPEKFTGYHTGWDFEILAGEASSDVAVVAFCDGKIVYKNFVNGYGGVVIQQCQIDGQSMTALYGHLRLASVTKKVGDSLAPGDKIGLLGNGNSSETDGERKHLHFSLHRGTSINLRGYVGSQLLLIDWIDPAKYLD